MKTLEDQWRQYRDAVYPAKNWPLDKFQETETRQAYFAGCLTFMTFAMAASRDMSEGDAFRFIAGLQKEAETVCKQRIYEMKGRN